MRRERSDGRDQPSVGSGSCGREGTHAHQADPRMALVVGKTPGFSSVFPTVHVRGSDPDQAENGFMIIKFITTGTHYLALLLSVTIRPEYFVVP
jgi:hypothetical protein